MKKLSRICAIAFLIAASSGQAQESNPANQAQPPALTPEPGTASDTDKELAKKIANPISSLISVPFQNNFDCCYGPSDAARYTLNFQPVVPVSLSSSAQVIVRTIVPFISEGSTASGVKGATDFGDITQSFFFKPKDTGEFVWGAGPAFVWPIGGSGFGSGKFGAGPTALILKQTKKGLTFGMLANQIWSYAGQESRNDFSNLFLQPFFSKNFPDTTNIGVNLESTYDWKHDQWTVPINFTVGHIFKFGKQPVQIAAAARYYAEAPVNGPSWGFRLTATFLFPK
jgi:hypothetical protein